MENRTWQPVRAARIKDFFMDCDPKTIKKNLNKFNKRGQSKMIRVFRTFVDLFLLDIIENNVIFALYSKYGSTFEFHMKQVGREFIFKFPYLFEDLDWVSTNFTAFVPTMTRIVGGKKIERHIIYSGFSRVVEKINNGDYNFVGESKTYKDYIPELKKLFPEEKESWLKRVINYGLLQMCVFICDKTRVILAGYKYSYNIGHGKNDTAWTRLLKKRENSRHDPPTGYYYFGVPKSRLSELQYKEGELINFGDVTLWRTLFPVTSRHYHKIFAVPMFEDVGRLYRKENFTTSYAVLVAEREETTNYKFTEHGWKHRNARQATKRISAARQTNCNKNWWKHHDVRFR